MRSKCPYMKGCPMYNLITTSVRIIQLQPFLNEYCLNSENYKECARYKLNEKGKEPHGNLLPNGQELKS